MTKCINSCILYTHTQRKWKVKEKKRKRKRQKPQSLSHFPAVKFLKKSLNIVLLSMCQFGPSYVTPAALLSQALNRWQVKWRRLKTGEKKNAAIEINTAGREEQKTYVHTLGRSSDVTIKMIWWLVSSLILSTEDVSEDQGKNPVIKKEELQIVTFWGTC